LRANREEEEEERRETYHDVILADGALQLAEVEDRRKEAEDAEHLHEEEEDDERLAVAARLPDALEAVVCRGVVGGVCDSI
jgi:hypothetical protein